MRTSFETMQCNGKLYNFHDILSLFCDFFVWKTQIDCLFLKDVIIHATSSYLLQISSGTPSKCMFWFNHLTIFEWRQWSHLTSNQSIEILILGFIPFFLFKNIDGWELLFCPYVHLRLMHGAPHCPSVRLWGTNHCLSSWPCRREPIGGELLICP